PVLDVRRRGRPAHRARELAAVQRAQPRVDHRRARAAPPRRPPGALRPRMTAARRSLTRTMLAAAAVAVLVATLRLFLRDWLAPLGVPNWAGSLLASLWVVLGVTAFLAFG